MKKRTYGIVAALVAVCAVAGVAFWLLSSGAPSYDKICRMNDDLKQARQLGLSTQEKCAERLGTAILKTTDETILANLLANVSFEERFANAILNKIKSPEAIETVARTFKTELLADESDTPFSEHLFDAILDRLADDAAVERIVTARLAEIGGEPIAKTGTRSKAASGKSNLVAGLVRRILAMHDGERSETLLEKTTGSGILRTLPLDTRLEIAIRSKSESVGQATGVDPDVLELRDLVAKWDSESLDLSVQEVLDRGREIRDAQKYVEIVQRFDPDYTNANIDKWVEYGKSIKPLLDSIDRLSNEQTDSSDSLRRSRLVAKRDKAQASFDECKKVIDETRAAVNANDFATIMAACKFAGVSFDASDPEDTGWRLGNKLRQLYQQAQTEKEDAERELAALDRAASSQRDSTNGQMSKLRSQLEQIRQRYETPESRKAREEREAAERKAREERAAAERRAMEMRKEAERKAAEAKAKERAIQLASSPAVKAVAESILASMIDIPGKGFKMGKTEVTLAQWEAIMGETPSRFPSRFKGENNPVVQVSWDDCQGFLSLLNSIPVVKDSGLTFRLPSEEEWEFACRAGATGKYGKYCKLADGTEITKDTLGQVAWFDDNSDKKPHPVGQKQPNAFGLYDMHGNVNEWTSTADGLNRVYRGGSWYGEAWACESWVRGRIRPSSQLDNLGFRLCASGRAD